MDQDHRIDDVEERISRLQEQGEKKPSASSGLNMSSGNVGVEFTVSILGGALLGWLIDWTQPAWAPWPLVGMTFVGFAAGLFNMWRLLNQKSAGKPEK